ncbi:hypothetical protein, partial [Gordonia sp. p3-SID1431]|uniref:hypothetical protein n=1 Tax=Gordonia sp. p3-SID1431 TaxID=2916159 RepID=UPI0021A3BE7F
RGSLRSHLREQVVGSHLREQVVGSHLREQVVGSHPRERVAPTETSIQTTELKEVTSGGTTT